MTNPLSSSVLWLAVLAVLTTGGVLWGTLLGGWVQLVRIAVSILTFMISRRAAAIAVPRLPSTTLPPEAVAAVVALAVWLLLDVTFGLFAWRVAWIVRRWIARRQYVPGRSALLPRSGFSWRERLAGGILGALRWGLFAMFLFAWQPTMTLLLRPDAQPSPETTVEFGLAGLRTSVAGLHWPELHPLGKAVQRLQTPLERQQAFAEGSYPCLEENPAVVALTTDRQATSAVSQGDYLRLALLPGTRALWFDTKCRVDLLALGGWPVPR